MFICGQDSEIAIVPLENPTDLTTNWQFAQVELAGSHYAAVCRENDGHPGGEYTYFVKGGKMRDRWVV